MPLKIPQSGLVAHYPLTENGGLIAFEKRGRKMNAALTNGAYFDKTYCRFDGSNDYIDPPDESVFSMASFSLSAKVRFAAVGVNQFIIDCSSNASFGFGYSVRLTSANKIRFWAYHANSLLDTPGTYVAGVTYNITCTYEGGTKLQSIYVDGRLVASSTHTFGFVNSTVSYLRIGGSNLLSGYTNGHIKDVLFYNRALTTNEVEAIYLRSKQTY